MQRLKEYLQTVITNLGLPEGYKIRDIEQTEKPPQSED